MIWNYKRQTSTIANQAKWESTARNKNNQNTEDLAWQISDILDKYNLAGGKQFFSNEETIILCMDFLIAAEDYLFKHLHLIEQKNGWQPLLSLNNLQLRPQGLSSYWNNFCFSFLKQYNELQVLPTDNPWHNFLFYSFGFDPRYELKILKNNKEAFKSLLNSKITLFRALWQLDIAELFCSILNSTGNNTKVNDFFNPFQATATNQRSANFTKKLLRTLSDEPDMQQSISLWEKHWLYNSGGYYSQYPLYSISQNKDLALKGHKIPITIDLRYLVGIDQNIKLLEDNIRQLIKSKKPANVFIWGEPGTGKTTSIKALAKKMHPKNIILIQLQQRQIKFLGQLLKKLQNFPQKFIIVGDDWGFAAHDPIINELKYIIDEQLNNIKNVVLYVISNRSSLVHIDSSDITSNIKTRHLVNEARAIDDRFGLKLLFEAPRFEKLKDFFHDYIKANNIHIKNLDATYQQFRQYCMHNQLDIPSGRAVSHFFKNY